MNYFYYFSNVVLEFFPMLYPIKVIDIELGQPIPTLEGLAGYLGVQALVRLHEVPLGYIKAPVSLDQCSAATLSKLILEQLSWAIISQLLKTGLTSAQRPEDLNLEDLINLTPVEETLDWPLVTVAVCTRDRPEDLRSCLSAIRALEYPRLDLLVIDNAPQTEQTKTLIEQHYPQVRYVREPRPGLDWARNRAILEAKGEIIAYTDDDVLVDKGWVKAIARTFLENPEAMAVNGLVVPYELETAAQNLFEAYGGFGRGFEQKVYRQTTNKLPWQWFGAGQFGTGANMAYRRSVFETIGYFDPALDVGTVTNGGGDLEMFVRVLKAGHPLIYQPQAMIRHRHRQSDEKLRQQISYNGVGLYALFTCLGMAYPEERGSLLYIAVWWFGWWHIRRLLLSFVYPQQFPRDLILAEFWGVFQHFGRYRQARRNANTIANQFPSEPQFPAPTILSMATEKRINFKETAIRSIDLSQPIEALTDITDYRQVRLYVSWENQLLGSLDIPSHGLNLGRTQLATWVTMTFSQKIIEVTQNLNSEAAWGKISLLAADYIKATAIPVVPNPQLPPTTSVSVVVATYDRPEDLRHCLTALTLQESPRPLEIIIVDNHPSSGITAPVVAEFPQVKLIQENRQGLSYARNAGIIASQGDIIVATDDDVTMPVDWLETLVQPFQRPDVMIVTGNVLPIELESEWQNFFEVYGGLGRGFQPFEVNRNWFEACAYRTVPTWNLGATANAAFRASLFRDPGVGLIDEALGAGTPTGCSEDTYIFYKTLKLGYTIAYEPNALVWHRHRSTKKAFAQQIYNYSKGHVAYHLTTLLNDRDFRVLARLLVGLPLIHVSRIYYRLRGWTTYPIGFVLLEAIGNLVGPWALWRSRLRVKRLGRSCFPEEKATQVASVAPVSIPISQSMR
jgi:O-antigen biosynthesis protein